MIRINLLPFRAARKSENIRRQVSLFFLSIILALVVIFAIQLYLGNQIGALEKDVAATKTELDKYKAKAKEVDKIKKSLDTLNKKTEVMTKLDKNRRDPVIFLDVMTQVIVPNRMWLRNMSLTGSTVKMSGVALDNKTTADFMSRLEDSGHFKNVTLHSVKQTSVGKQQMKSFSITCVKVRPTSANKK